MTLHDSDHLRLETIQYEWSILDSDARYAIVNYLVVQVPH